LKTFDAEGKETVARDLRLATAKTLTKNLLTQLNFRSARPTAPLLWPQSIDSIRRFTILLQDCKARNVSIAWARANKIQRGGIATNPSPMAFMLNNPFIMH
jgi:hypothetical protein